MAATTVLDRLYGARRSLVHGDSPVEVLTQLDAAIAVLTSEPADYDPRGDLSQPDPGPIEAPDLAPELF